MFKEYKLEGENRCVIINSDKLIMAREMKNNVILLCLEDGFSVKIEEDYDVFREVFLEEV